MPREKNIMMIQRRKDRQLKRDTLIKSESKKRCKKEKLWKIEHQILHIRKSSIRKILKCNLFIKNVDTMKIQKLKNKISKGGLPGKLGKTNGLSKKKVSRKS